MRETLIEKHLVKEVKKRGGMCVKFWPIYFAGFPDRLVFLPGGVFMLVELKAGGKKPSPLQKIVHDQLKELGFRVEICDTKEKIDELW